jgi:hypothetical protein
MAADGPAQRQVFRPAAGLRALGAAMCLLSLGAWLTVLFTYPRHHGLPRIAAASVLALPCLAGAALLFRRIEIDGAGLGSMGVFGARRLAWPDVRRIDVRRGTFVIESSVGPISAALIDPAKREMLLRTVIDQAALVRAQDELPWGIDSRYLPRRQDIAFTDFVPHNLRKKGGR